MSQTRLVGRSRALLNANSSPALTGVPRALIMNPVIAGQTAALGLAGARVSAQALIALGGDNAEWGVEALSELLERARQRRALAALDEWVAILAGRCLRLASS